MAVADAVGGTAVIVALALGDGVTGNRVARPRVGTLGNAAAVTETVAWAAEDETAILVGGSSDAQAANPKTKDSSRMPENKRERFTPFTSDRPHSIVWLPSEEPLPDNVIRQRFWNQWDPAQNSSLAMIVW